MRPVSLLAFAATSALLAASPLLAQGDYTATRTGTANASGATSIRIANGSGRLTVTGNPSATSVRATGTAHADRKGDLDNVKLVVERNGNVIEVHPDYDSGMFHDCDCWMDLTVEVPTSVGLQVTDGSGGAELRNVGAVDVRSGSGGIRIQGTSGDVVMKSGSGRATATDVHGDVRASSGSGGVTLERVTGSVEIEHSGSGDVSLHQVSGSVHVGSIGSGSVDANGVGGDLTVDRKGSGSVSYNGVKGKVSVPNRDW